MRWQVLSRTPSLVVSIASAYFLRPTEIRYQKSRCFCYARAVQQLFPWGDVCICSSVLEKFQKFLIERAISKFLIQLRGWPVPASLFFEDVVNLLKCLFALTVAQNISSLEKYGSILLEFNRDGGELPSPLNFCHEVAHVGKQGFEYDLLLIFLYCFMNHWLQLRPAWRLTCARSRLWGRCVRAKAHTLAIGGESEWPTCVIPCPPCSPSGLR